jgi:hypothetical protein
MGKAGNRRRKSRRQDLVLDVSPAGPSALVGKVFDLRRNAT